MTGRRAWHGLIGLICLSVALVPGVSDAVTRAPSAEGGQVRANRVLWTPTPTQSGSGPTDYVLPSGTSERLLTPGAGAPGAGPDGAVGAQASKKYTYAISVVAIPLKGQPLGATRSGMRSMVDSVGARMLSQTNGRATFRFHSWTKAPVTTSARLPCDVENVHDKYLSYANGLRHTPSGYTDTIALYFTPLRLRCPFSGMAILTGDGTYLNGVDLTDPQRLQNWITAHELGHNLGLVHSGSFSARESGWSIATDPVPQDSDAQRVEEYGDYLDIMGQPPAGGEGLSGTDFADWVIDGVNLFNLGVLPRSQLTIVRRSGTYTLAPLLPTGAPKPPSVIAIPVLADLSKSYWVLEYRPASQSAASGLNYPEPWLSAGYGVRLLSTAHEAGLEYSINKVWHQTRDPRGAGHLPAEPVRLGGQSTVTVLGTEAERATIRITIPSRITATTRWLSAQRLADARKGAQVSLPVWTDQGRSIAWSVITGSNACAIRHKGSRWFRYSTLLKRVAHGSCVVRARAKPISYAFYAGLDQSARYTFTKGRVSRELLP